MTVTETQIANIQPTPNLPTGRPEGAYPHEAIDKIKAGMLGATALNTEVQVPTDATENVASPTPKEHIDAALVQHFGDRIAERRERQMGQTDAVAAARAPHVEQSHTASRQSVARRELMAQTR
ncbi:hypothetical protein KC951_01190 [Candidatus Saccharibacteria bacterium]|nr:hypothetical protein [Candidatus Saccharibacteria bacterium]